MQATRKFIQIFRFTLAGAVVMYFFVILRIPSSAKPNPILLRALGLVAITQAILIFVIRRIQVFRAQAVLEDRPDDAKALLRWRAGHIVTYSISLSIAFYGLALHFLGFPLGQVGPFFISGLALILFLGPKAISSNTSGSAPIVPR